MPFAPGQSGNPAGKPKGAISLSAKMLREKLTVEDFDLALETLRRTMRQEKNPNAAHNAAQFVVEQMMGKAIPSGPIQFNHTLEIKELKDIPTEELLEAAFMQPSERQN